MTCGWQKEEDEIIAAIENKPWILLWNKSDLLESTKKPVNHKQTESALATIAISAKTRKGIDILANTIEEWTFARGKEARSGSLSKY